MTNSESLGAESATAPTTKPESDDLNMSAGAEMLIARMKTNPEDFRYNGRFYRVIEAVRAGAPNRAWISTRDIAALRAAFEVHIQESEFTEWVYNEIFNPKEDVPLTSMYAQAQMQGQKVQLQNAMLAMGLSAPGSLVMRAEQAPQSPMQRLKTKIGL